MREATIERRTSETALRAHLVLDGRGESRCATGIGFLDHMLTLFAKHGLFDLELEVTGDLHVDFHHTVEDTGIGLGQAFLKALGDKAGIRRYGCSYLPMDEALARVVVDLSGRPFLAFDAPPRAEPIAPGFSFQLIEEFFRAFAVNAAINLHASVLAGRDSHHMAEALFKGLARALDEATARDSRVHGIPSTKGML